MYVRKAFCDVCGDDKGRCNHVDWIVPEARCRVCGVVRVQDAVGDFVFCNPCVDQYLAQWSGQ